MTHVFDTAKTYNIEVVVKNALNQPKKVNFSVEITKPVEGFNVRLQNNTVTGYGAVVFKISVDKSKRFPMGTIYFDLDVNAKKVIHNMSLDDEHALLNDGVTVSHEINIEGNYSVVAKIYSNLPFDEMRFSFSLEVWEFLTIPETKSFVFTNEEIFLQNAATVGRRFEYIIDYGNGDTATNQPDVFTNGIHSPFSYHYNSSGTYRIYFFVKNPAYEISSTKSILVFNRLPDLDVEPHSSSAPNYVPITEHGTAVKLYMISPDDQPPDMMYCLFVFEHGDSPFNVSVSMTYSDPFVLTHTYHSTGTKTITIQCTNSVETKEFTTQVTVLPSIQGFQIIGHNRVDLDSTSNFNEIIHFSYTSGERISVSAKLYSDPVIMVDAILNSNTKSGSVQFKKGSLQNMSLGVFRLEITLQSLSGETQSKGAAIFHEERISGFQVRVHVFFQ